MVDVVYGYYEYIRIHFQSSPSHNNIHIAIAATHISRHLFSLFPKIVFTVFGEQNITLFKIHKFVYICIWYRFDVHSALKPMLQAFHFVPIGEITSFSSGETRRAENGWRESGIGNIEKWCGVAGWLRLKGGGGGGGTDWRQLYSYTINNDLYDVLMMATMTMSTFCGARKVLSRKLEVF